MSRILIIGSDKQVSRKIGDALTTDDFPMEFMVFFWPQELSTS